MEKVIVSNIMWLTFFLFFSMVKYGYSQKYYVLFENLGNSVVELGDDGQYFEKKYIGDEIHFTFGYVSLGSTDVFVFDKNSSKKNDICEKRFNKINLKTVAELYSIYDSKLKHIEEFKDLEFHEVDKLYLIEKNKTGLVVYEVLWKTFSGELE